MRIWESPELARFRAEVRDWLQRNVPREPRPQDKRAGRDYDLSWQARQYAAGWAGIAWPREYGGLGLELDAQMVWYEEYARADGPSLGASFVGLSHAALTIMAKGTEQQKATYLPPILRGEVVWCQGFSEPDAGSDLASLRTTGTVEGDKIVVTGRKIWTSHAMVADLQELLVRTGPPDSRHRGLTWLICDMRSPGVEVRPLRTMHGQQHFAEVTYDDVRIPLENVVGEIDSGWSVAMATLSFERGTAFISEQVRLARRVDELVRFAAAVKLPGGRSVLDDDEIRREFAHVWSSVRALRALAYRNVNRAMRGSTPGPEGSVLRLYHALTVQRVAALALRVTEQCDWAASERESADAIWSYFDSFRATIAAGTKDVQRSIIAERMLGLPRSR